MTPNDGFRNLLSCSALLLRFRLRTDFSSRLPGAAVHVLQFRLAASRSPVRPWSRLRANSSFLPDRIAERPSVMGCHSTLRPSRNSWRHRRPGWRSFANGRRFRLVSPHRYRMPAISFCFPFLFPFHLAWHSLGLKPCARRLRPFCFAQRHRALGVSAPPTTFQTSRKPGSMKSCRSPRKSTSPDLGAAASRYSGAQTKRAEKE